MELNKTIVSIVMVVIGLIIAFNILGTTVEDVQEEFDTNNLSNLCTANSCYWNVSESTCGINVTNQTIQCPNDYTTIPQTTLALSSILIFMLLIGVVVIGAKAFMTKK